jgi:hypothetical protein
VPVISLLVPSTDLDEIHSTTFIRGRQSERAAYVGFFEAGELTVSTGAGVRIHGGRSRERQSWRSYRLTARRRYGEPIFSPAPFPDEPEPSPKRLVLRANRGFDTHNHMWFFSSPLAMDIARQAGAETPRSRPVLFLLNGRNEGVYELSDYLGPDLIRDRYGIEELILVRTKQNTYEAGRSMVKTGPEEPYEDLRQRARFLLATPQPAGVGEWIDLGNLYRWVTAVTFLATSDVFQGALVRDLADPSARWFWIAWDLEISFGLPQKPYQRGWRDLSLQRLLTTDRPDVRRILFSALMNSPEERRRFVALAVETLNHRIHPSFLEGRIAHYRDQAELFGIEDRSFLDEMADYLVNRPAAYRQQLRDSFGLGAARRVRVTGPPGSRLEIDDYATRLPWEGEYFDGMTIRLTPPPGVTLSVDGAPPSGERGPLEIELHNDHEITLLGRLQTTSALSATIRHSPSSSSTSSSVLRTTSE